MVDDQEWMKNVFRILDKKWEKKKLVWAFRHEPQSREYIRLAEEYVPFVLDMSVAVYLRYDGKCDDVFSFERHWKYIDV